MLNVLGMIVDRYDGVLPCRIPASAPARNRSVRSSSRRCERTSSSCAERARVERERDLVRDGLGAGVGTAAGAGRRDEGRRVAGVRLHLLGERQPGRRVGGPGEAEGGEPGPGLGRGGGLELGGGQDVGERVEVVADADPALGDRLERGRAAAAEGVEDDVARPRVARDEGVGERRREAREVRAHRVEAVAPEAGLVLPLGFDPERGEGARQLEGELAGGDGLDRGVWSGIPGLDGTAPALGSGAKGGQRSTAVRARNWDDLPMPAVAERRRSAPARASLGHGDPVRGRAESGEHRWSSVRRPSSGVLQRLEAVTTVDAPSSCVD